MELRFKAEFVEAKYSQIISAQVMGKVTIPSPLMTCPTVVMDGALVCTLSSMMVAVMSGVACGTGVGVAGLNQEQEARVNIINAGIKDKRINFFISISFRKHTIQLRKIPSN